MGMREDRGVDAMFGRRCVNTCVLETTHSSNLASPPHSTYGRLHDHKYPEPASVLSQGLLYTCEGGSLNHRQHSLRTFIPTTRRPSLTTH